jgi:phosphatidylinositol glycan class N
MASIGLLYLIFEDSILGVSVKVHSISRAIIGVQVGLIILAMVVTQSAVSSIQAKEGLSLGTQVVGWAVTGMKSLIQPTLADRFKSPHWPSRFCMHWIRSVTTCIAS